MAPTNGDIQRRLNQFETNLSALTEQVKNLTLAVSDVTKLQRDRSEAADKQNAQLMVAISEAKAPHRTDWTAFASWAGVTMLVLGSIFGLVGAFQFRELDAMKLEFRTTTDKLDDKLQKEYAQSTDKLAQGLNSLNDTSKERHDDVVLALDRIKQSIVLDEAKQWDTVKMDLEELRQRRTKK